MPPKPGRFFDKVTTDDVLRSFYGRNNSLESQHFGFSNSLAYVLEESIE